MFIQTNCEVIQIYPQTIVMWVSWMSCSPPNAWCHQMKLKRQGYRQIIVIVAANIILISASYAKNKSHDLCELTTYFTDKTGQKKLLFTSFVHFLCDLSVKKTTYISL